MTNGSDTFNLLITLKHNNQSLCASSFLFNLATCKIISLIIIITKFLNLFCNHSALLIVSITKFSTVICSPFIDHF